MKPEVRGLHLAGLGDYHPCPSYQRRRRTSEINESSDHSPT